jgi:PTS system nitrogen regulatory IIA component
MKIVKKNLHLQLTVKEVAKLLNLSDKKVYRLIARDEIPVNKIGDEYRFNRVELVEWATTMGIRVASDAFEGSNQDNSSPTSFLDALKVGNIFYKVGGTDKSSVLRNLVDVLNLPGDIDPEFLFQVLLAREKLGSTGIGGGIAIPHVRNPVILNVKKPIVTLCFLEHAIDFDAIDGLPVNVLFMLISPTIRMHLHLLSRLGYVLQNPGFKAAIQKQASPEVITSALAKAEAALPAKDNSQQIGEIK